MGIMAQAVHEIKAVWQRIKQDWLGQDVPVLEVPQPVNPEVVKAIENYDAAVNRYNHSDLSDPQLENLYYLERQVAYASLQLALAKARILAGGTPTMDYTVFEKLCRLVG